MAGDQSPESKTDAIFRRLAEIPIEFEEDTPLIRELDRRIATTFGQRSSATPTAIQFALTVAMRDTLVEHGRQPAASLALSERLDAHIADYALALSGSSDVATQTAELWQRTHTSARTTREDGGSQPFTP